VTATDLSEHYTHGQAFLQDTFFPYVKTVLTRLSGEVWQLDDFVGYAAGTDVDFITHIIDACENQVVIYPGDWGGFLVGPSRPVSFSADSRGALACLCVPSVRNGLLTDDMLRFLAESRSNLLNLNLFPTLAPAERRQVALALDGMLHRSLLSISFSRGFALTASQIGVLLIHRQHSLLKWRSNWEWFSLFYNTIAARAFMKIDLPEVDRVHAVRRLEVAQWHEQHDFPWQPSGSYYVKSFRIAGELPAAYNVLIRDGILRLCFKPRSE
jgi:hypothetical protein